MRRKTLRKMSPVARKLAKMVNEVKSLERRLKNLIAVVESLELDSNALRNTKGEPVNDKPIEKLFDD